MQACARGCGRYGECSSVATTSRSASPSTPVKGGLCGVARRCLPSAGANASPDLHVGDAIVYRFSGSFTRDPVTVTPKIVELPQKRVDLIFEINEGPKSGITRINIDRGVTSDELASFVDALSVMEPIEHRRSMTSSS